MGVVDLAADWRCANADRLVPVTVRQVDPDAGPADTDELADDVRALQWETASARSGARGGEVSSQNCTFEFAAADVGFDLYRRCRVTDPAGVVWIVDEVQFDSTGSLARCPCTRARGA